MAVVIKIDQAVARLLSAALKSKYPNYKFVREQQDFNEPVPNEPTLIYDRLTVT